MHPLFKAVNAVCDKLQVVSDLFWNFPTNFDWYANIPILGNFSLAIILLIGSGIFFTCQLRFIQVRKFKYGLHVLKTQKAKTGISPLASFLLSTAMRVGPGNILGVTGAISIGGPGALFWMWFSALAWPPPSPNPPCLRSSRRKRTMSTSAASPSTAAVC